MSQKHDGLVRFDCPNGHRLKADPRHAGRRCKCPACGEISLVPAGDESMTPSAVVRFLDQCKTASHVLRNREKQKQQQQAYEERRSMNAECPRCKELIQATARVCHHCKLYFGDASPRQITMTRHASD